MYARSGRRLARFIGAAWLTAVVAACGTSSPRPPAAGEPVAVGGASGVDAGRTGAAGHAADSAAADGAPGTPSSASVPPVEVAAAAAASHARAVQAMTAKNWVEAELELEQLVLEYPDYPGPYVNLAILYRRDGRDAEAEAALERALAIAPGHPAANSEHGVMLRERGEFAAAEAAYRRALETDPGYGLAHYNLGVLLDLYLRRRNEALEHYEAFQALLPEPDIEVGRWIVDLRRRLGLPEETVQLAREDRR